MAIAWLLVISVLFILPGKAFPRKTWLDDIHFDKIVHFALFLVLVILAAPAFRTGFPALLLAVIYGLVIEAVQHLWVPNRSFDLIDLLANTLGALAGIFLWLWAKNKPL